ncbi:iron ABC transporter permease [Corynebacterium diphtheriae]|nr:iron ABC transporter permease [Corynebacterium diphtheriae]CAB0858120.1 iron ABC transporter permease [Corynebacterium diphtheriae]CAB0921249.1 iron ABC transporter permease [Corynebacterium diphtheriae]
MLSYMKSVIARRSRRALGLLGLLAALVALAFASLALGAKATSIGELADACPTAWEMLRGRLDVNSAVAGGVDNATVEVASILATMRVPRTVLALVVGAALAVAGGIFLLGWTSMQSHLILAFVGAGLAALLVFGLTAAGLGSGDTLGLVLAGAALSAVLAALTSAIIYIDPNALDSLRFWRAGSVTGRGFDIIVPALLPLGVGALLALAMGPTLNVLNLGAEAAQALGTNVGRANALGLVAITLLAGAATAAAGPIGFVGLVVPHVARSITGPDYKWVLPYSGLAGACLLLLADIIGRLVMRPGELQAGIVIALIGAPAFIWLVRHRKLVSI